VPQKDRVIGASGDRVIGKQNLTTEALRTVDIGKGKIGHRQECLCHKITEIGKAKSYRGSTRMDADPIGKQRQDV
jgi:hypothetical protein